jgi:cobalt-precorrin 5A hydrolase/precorrin-3B C17-methyltransferase
MVDGTAVIILTEAALPLARRIADDIDGAEVHGLDRRCADADVSFADTMAHVAALFAQGRTIIGICAAGILIRAVAPVLADKHAEPPLIAVSADGASIVPLLGGHHGANALAAHIAKSLGAVAAVTTAGDVRFDVALDEPPLGWALANPENAKSVMAALLDGAEAKLKGEAPWLRGSALPLSPQGAVELVASERLHDGSPQRLIYHPRTLVLGVGCERGCAPEELIELAETALCDAGLAPAALAAIVSLDLKSDEAAVHALAGHLGVPARFVSADQINAIADRIANPSDIVLREVGCPGVAEGAALVAAGDDGDLIVEKAKSTRATCAVARAAAPLDAENIGRSRGRVCVIGLGPGERLWRSGQAGQLLSEVTDWVGYGLYLDLAADLAGSQIQHRFDLGEEEARVRHALELAGEGRDVALICSGDPGIYAMATLVYELLDEGPDGAPLSDAARRAEIVVAPGISAFQAAAAKSGAPIGHDFCAISLSDLLTPWEAIERRVHAAAESDFVVAFYNPRSLRRRDQLVRAIEILRQHRPAGTPVIIASDIGRPKEHIRTVPLADFDPEVVDMLTLVMVGASSTTTVATGDGNTWVYTPRGYDKKRTGQTS